MLNSPKSNPRIMKSNNSPLYGTKYWGTVNQGSIPKNQDAIEVPTTVDNSTGITAIASMPIKTTSKPKSAPPMGALKIAAIPAEIPQTVNTRNSGSLSFSNCPMLDPIPAPICPIGPSAPALPPDPMVIAELMALTSGTRGRILP